MPLEYFYTLPASLEEHRIIWRIDPRLWNHINLLRQKIEPSAELNDEILEAIIAYSLFEKLQQHPEHELIRNHWIAFLERRCEQVAGKTLSFLPIHLRPSYFRDLFLIGCEMVSDSVKFFDSFDNRRSPIDYWYPALKRFCEIKIKHLLLPKLKEITGLETVGITNLGLVTRSSRKRVKEALEHSGCGEIKISQSLLIWQCLQEIRNSTNLGINNFTLEHFQEIAKRYQDFQGELALSETQTKNITGEEIRAFLINIGAAIRRFLNPPIDSLNTSFHFQLNEDKSLLENIPNQEEADEEMNQTVAALKEFIIQLLNELEESIEKQTLFLRYGLELKQVQVGKELGGQPQYQVCRNLQRLHNRILLQIRDWVRQPPKLEPSSEELNEIEAVLCQCYSEQFDRFFERAIVFLGRQSRELLRLFYIVKLQSPEIGEKIHKSEAEVKELLDTMRQWFYSNVTEQIQTEIQLEFQPQSTAIKKISNIIEIRLKTILQLYLP